MLLSLPIDVERDEGDDGPDALTVEGRFRLEDIGSVPEWDAKGDAWFERGELARAIAVLEEAVGNDPELGGAWYNRGRALEQMGRGFEARISFSKALARYEADLDGEPKNADLWRYKAACLEKVGYPFRAWIARLQAWWYGR